MFDLKTINANQATQELFNTLNTLGKSELASAAGALQKYLPSVVNWQLDRAAAEAKGDVLKVNAVDRSFGQLKAAVILDLATTGVLAQAEGEKYVGMMLKLGAKLAIGAAATASPVLAALVPVVANLAANAVAESTGAGSVAANAAGVVADAVNEAAAEAGVTPPAGEVPPANAGEAPAGEASSDAGAPAGNTGQEAPPPPTE